MYAIIEASGKQIRVTSGEKVAVDVIAGEPNSEIVFDKVLAIVKDGNATYGTPYVKGAQVKAEIEGSFRDKKVLVFRNIPKKAIRKLLGHRQEYTTLRIKEIIGG